MLESRIVIAGGGFAGLYAALELEKLFKRDDRLCAANEGKLIVIFAG